MELQLLIVSFVAGVLTILAPCIFPLLPVLLGASSGSASRAKAFRIVGSLLVSITILTLLLHGASNALGLDEGVLRAISSVILIVIGLAFAFPKLWEQLMVKLGLGASSNKLLGKAMQKDGAAGDVLIGASLGPVFSSCSPTYGIIIATILPTNFFEGTFYLLWYILGLGLMFMLIIFLGNRLTSKLAWATDPDGWFKRAVGVVFVLIGMAVMFGWDKDFEAWLLQFEFYERLVSLEFDLMN